MSRPNRGKDFEEKVKSAFEEAGICIDRIHDQMSGFAGSANVCDFIVYRKPTLLYLECKTCYGNTLNFHNITENQWNGLARKSKIDGVVAGVMIWFIDHNKTIFVPIQNLIALEENGERSVNINTIDPKYYQEVKGQKKRVFFDYDMRNFFVYITRRWA